MSHDSLSDLLDLFDRQVAFLLEQDDARLIVALPRFVEFLTKSDARLSSVASMMRLHVRTRERAFAEHDGRVRAELKALWPRYRALVQKIGAGVRDRNIFDVHGDVSAFERRLEERSPPTFPTHKEVDDDPSTTSDLLDQLEQWLHPSFREGTALDDDPEANELSSRLRGLARRHQHAYRRFWLDGHSLAGAALERLETRARSLNPEPPGDDPSAEGVWWLEGYLVHDLVSAVFDPHDRGSNQQQALKSAAESSRREIRVVHLAARGELLLRRSHLALIKRFAAKAERYDVDGLRRLCKLRRNVEAKLTDRFAEFLFDQGLNPIVDPKIARLRPDLLDLGVPIYAEAKQYRRAQKSQLRRAVAQVFDTWGRLRSAGIPLDEAFLVIFRLGGPRIEVPELLSIQERTLYLWVVDLAPEERSGSRQSLRPVVISSDDVIEWSQSSNRRINGTPTSGPKVRRKNSPGTPRVTSSTSA